MLDDTSLAAKKTLHLPLFFPSLAPLRLDEKKKSLLYGFFAHPAKTTGECDKK
jgi:hypothetical protein